MALTIVWVLVGIIAGHQLVWLLVKHLRDEGQTFHRYQIFGFVALEMLLGLLLWRSGSMFIFLCMVVNIGVLLYAHRVPPPPMRR